MKARALVPAVVVVALVALSGCGREGAAERPPRGAAKLADPGPVHVHGLGVNPRDGALFVATHTGLFRAPRGEERAERVADRYQDTMGFTVTGADEFLGSGHPDGRENLPPFLGLIRSRDAGKTWQQVSLAGKVDFHVLEAAGTRVYGFGSDFETGDARFLASEDGGRSWRRLRPPAVVVQSLAIHPSDPDRLALASGTDLFVSSDAGRRWRKTGGPAGLLAWTDDGAFAADATGAVWRGEPGDDDWERAGNLGGGVAAFEPAADGSLYAALHDGAIKASRDGGRTWTVRSRP